jgi:hypothetical protein
MGAAAAALVLTLFLNWFEVATTAGESSQVAAKVSGWGGLSLGVEIVIVLALVACAATVLLVQFDAPVAPTVFITVVATTLSIAMLIAVIVDVLRTQGGATDLLWPAVAGILFGAMVALGAWRSMGDERLDAPDSKTTLPKARDIPG